MKTNTYIISSLRDYFYKIVFIFLLLYSFSSKAQTTLDDFTDGDYTSNPSWTVATGSASVTSNALVVTTSIVKISTPFTTPCSEWYVDLRSNSSSNSNRIRYYFILSNSSDPANAAADGYCIEYSSTAGDIWLKRLDNGTTQVDGSALGYYNGTEYLTTARTIRITQNTSNQFEIFVNGISRIIATDATYASSSVQFQSFWILTSNTYSWTIDNIKYVSACFNPTSGGTIGNGQGSCGSFDPAAITSSVLPTGHTGTLEYKWQQSTTSSITGFTDISTSNATTYDPPVLTQTTWYKRLARVNCKSDWSGAAESNVVEITISSSLVFDGIPVNDTIYNELGNASFGVSLAIPTGATYQWQVSANNGNSWANLSNGGFYTGVTDSILQITNPTYSMNGYLYRCLATNFCGTINSGSGGRLNVIQLSTFSNTTSTSCGTNFNNDFSFQRTITVTGLPTALGTSSEQYILREVRLKLGSSTCKGGLGTYSARLKSPLGTTISLFSGFTASSTSMWADIKYRDHPALERVKDYQASIQSGYFPYKIGYYAPETDNTFDDFNGQNPNGTWILELAENTDLTNDGGVDDEVSFVGVDLVFGPPFVLIDLTGSSSNNNCSSSTCSSTQEIIVGTNNSYSETDPNYPSISGCSWNGANNNSAWFKFTASTSTSKITISGLNGGGSNDQQPIIVKAPTSCSSPNVVPTGGCPDDESINNSSYLSTNGGGTSSGNVYFNGITANCEFNLSSLVVNDNYYLYIDGNGGTSSSFYIELESGAQTCRTLLPVELSVFKASYIFPFAHLTWRTESELNNDRFEIEKSIGGINWKYITAIKGNGTTSAPQDYYFIDEELIDQITYYRLKQIDYNGEFNYSFIETVIPNNSQYTLFFPNPANQQIQLVLKKEIEFNFQIIDQLGRIVVKGKNEANNNNISIEQLDAGVYVLFVNDTCYGKLIKQ